MSNGHKPQRTFGFCLAISMPVGVVVGGAFGLITANVFDRDPAAHLEPMRGLILGVVLAIVIGLGGAIAARFELH